MATVKEADGNPFEDRTVDPPEAEGVEVDVSADDDPIDEPREEKRRKRGRDRWEERERELERASAQLSESQQRIARLEAQVAAVAQREQRNEPDELEQEFDSVWSERERLAAEFGRIDPRQVTAEVRADYMGRAKKLERKQQEVVARIEARKHVRPAEDPQITALRVKHSDVISDPTRFSAAQLYYNNKLRSGATPGPELVEESMSYGRKFSFDDARRQARVSDTDRARHVGPPAGGARGSSEDAPKSVKLTKDDMRMADTLFPHIDDSKRYQHFAKEVLLKRKNDTDNA